MRNRKNRKVRINNRYKKNIRMKNHLHLDKIIVNNRDRMNKKIQRLKLKPKIMGKVGEITFRFYLNNIFEII